MQEEVYMKIFRFCLPYLNLEKNRILIYILLSIMTAAIEILSPYILGDFIDYLTIGGEAIYVIRFCLIFTGLNIVRIIKDYLMAMLYTKIQVKVGYNLNFSVISHIQEISLLHIKKEEEAYLNQRINGDAYNLISFCLDTINSFSVNTIFVLVSFVILYRMNSFITIVMVFFIFIYIAIYFFMKEKVYEAGFNFKESQAHFFSSLFEQLKYIKIIKINSIKKEINNRLDKRFNNFFNIAIESQKVNYMYNSLDRIISILAQITLFIIGGMQVLKGNFTVGMFTIFSSYFNMILNACRYFFTLGSVYQNALSSYDRIKEYLQFPRQNNGKIKLKDIKTISFENVSFSYAEDENLIDRLSYDFNKGNIYSIIGENGSGKSTSMDLLVGLYVGEYEGKIFYNDINIDEIDMVDARSNLISVAEQEPSLIQDTILYNLTFSNIESGNTKKQINEYLKILNMEEFFYYRKLGYNLDEKNTNISGGEKQKIAILRVLLKDSPLMIFDEPTSALDSKSIKSFLDYLELIKKDKIIINITHNHDLLDYSDHVINLNNLN